MGALLNKPRVDAKKRTAYVTLYLKRVIDEFNATNQNIKLTASYFCKADKQENFNSFLLDQRVEVGKIVKNWLVFLRENESGDVILMDVYVFVERILRIFCVIYALE